MVVIWTVVSLSGLKSKRGLCVWGFYIYSEISSGFASDYLTNYCLINYTVEEGEEVHWYLVRITALLQTTDLQGARLYQAKK